MTLAKFIAAFAVVQAGLAWSVALAEDSTAPAASAPAVETSKSVLPSAAVVGTSAAGGEERYTPPPGYKTKTRKGETVYCRSRAPLGTRIKSEECFTEAEIKEVERAMATSTDDMQQRGRMCTTGMMCTGGG